MQNLFQNRIIFMGGPVNDGVRFTLLRSYFFLYGRSMSFAFHVRRWHRWFAPR